MKETLWLVRKTVKTTFKNYKNWLLYLVMPVVGIILASLIYGGSQANVLHIGIVNHDPGQVITNDVIQFVERLENIQISEIAEPQSHELIETGELDAVLVIPEGFAQSVKTGDLKSIQLKSIKGTHINDYIKMYLNSYLDTIATLGHTVQGQAAEFDALYAEYREMDFRLSTMHIEDQSVTNNMSKQSIGYLVILMLFSAVSLSAILIKEKENRTYHRLLCAPITSGMYVVSNVVVNFIVMMLQIGVTLFVMTRFFHMNPGIPIGVMFFVLLIFALVAISLSLMLVAFSKSSMEANASQNMIIIPTSLLAGCMFPIETMPLFIQQIGNFLPQYWLLETVGELQQGSSLAGVYLNLFILLAFALTFALIAIYKFGRSNDVRSYY